MQLKADLLNDPAVFVESVGKIVCSSSFLNLHVNEKKVHTCNYAKDFDLDC